MIAIQREALAFANIAGGATKNSNASNSTSVTVKVTTGAASQTVDPPNR